MLPSWSAFSVFLLASVVVAVTPGPGVLYIVTRSIVQGRQSGLASVAGVALGNLGNSIAASIGVAALIAVSSTAFLIIKYLGALYLVYLGVKMFRSAADSDVGTDVDTDPAATPAPTSRARILSNGFVVALLNPKTALFFAAFLPQFLSGGTPPIFQSLVLGVIFVLIAATTDSLYALAAGSVAPMLRSRKLRRNSGRAGGSVFIGLGIFTALCGGRGAS